VKPRRGRLRKRESHLWIRDPHDYYVEPPWVSRRLFELERFGAIWDPACGSGQIVQSARLHGYRAVGTDIVKRSEYCVKRRDFLRRGFLLLGGYDIVSNPPFGLARAFVTRALEIVAKNRGKVALLLPSKWIQGDNRARWIETTPLVRVYFVCPRPSMPPGHVKNSPGNGTTDYAWFVWDTGRKRRRRPTIDWLFRDPH
jgi:hypothetical protein